MDKNSNDMNENKTLMQKMQKYEPLIAGIALAIGLALFAGFIITFVIKTNKQAEQLTVRTSSAYYSNPYYDDMEEVDFSLDVMLTSEGEEIVQKYELYSGVELTADSDGKTVLVDESGKKVPETIFVSDEGQRITASPTDNGVIFKDQDSAITTFVLNGHTFVVNSDNTVTIDGIKVLSDPAAVAVTTTEEIPPTETTSPEETAEPETTTAETTTSKSAVTTVTTTKAPAVTTTPKPQTKPTAPPATTTSKTTTTTRKTTTTTTAKKTTTTTKKATTTTKASTAAYKTDDKFVAEVLKLVNEQRAKNGVPALQGSIALDQAAQVRAKEIGRSYDDFSHTRPSGQDWYTVLNERGIKYKNAGENIAEGYPTAKELVQGWMDSPAHRKNILDPDFTHMGLGYYDAEDGWRFAAQLFATF